MAMEFKLPDVGEGTTEGEIVRWLVEVGEKVELDQPLVEVETDKAVVELPSPCAGVIMNRYGEVGEIVPVGSTLVVIGEGGDAAGSPPERPPVVSEPRPPREAGSPPADNVQAAPFTRRMAKQHGVELAGIVGSGPKGRIVPDDIRRLTEPPGRGPVLMDAADDPREMVIRGTRRRVAEHLEKSWREVPHVTVVEKYELSELVRLRQELKPEAAKEGIRLTYLAFLIKALAICSRQYPEFNARWQGDRVFQHRAVDVGIAVDTDQGLTVPVVRDAGKKTLLEISQAVTQLADGARRRTLRPEELSGSTITVTAGGELGGLFATPIIHAPEVAIVGMYRIQPEAVIRDGEVRAGQIGYFSLTFDHRVSDGMRAANFLNALGETMAHPHRMLLHLG
jgi:pyruvate dehydrogenase E2 component (dihydrolipoamide acetyltransferase)